jgi:hypothetical protein
MKQAGTTVCDLTKLKDFLREQRLKQVAKKAA